MDIINLVAQTGGTLGLAIFAIWMLNRVWQDRLAAAKERVADIRSMWDATQQALTESTKAIVANTETMRESRAVMEQLVLLLNQTIHRAGK